MAMMCPGEFHARPSLEMFLFFRPHSSISIQIGNQPDSCAALENHWDMYRLLLFILSLVQNVQLVDSVTISVTSMEKRARAFQSSDRVLSLVGILDELLIPNCSILSTFRTSCMRYRAEEQIDLVNGPWNNVNFSSLQYRSFSHGCCPASNP